MTVGILDEYQRIWPAVEMCITWIISNMGRIPSCNAIWVYFEVFKLCKIFSHNNGIKLLVIKIGENPNYLKLTHCTEKSSWGKPIKSSATKSLQSCPTLCDPRDGSPPGSTVGICVANTVLWGKLIALNI